ncbi:hypothetical protein LJC59_07895 [Desulfovibrio sp. OttesenSCG-928-A18]|nr:hypothetical protein [Desulfovibrio sp. OttesenSCG-928-A18]
MTKVDSNAFLERVFLRSDNGAELSFRGKLYSESAYYDEETASLTRLRLFVSEGRELVYSIVSGAGAQKTRRHYVVEPKEDLCRISDGIQTLTLPTEMLFAAVFGLCGIDPERAEELKPGFEENLRMVIG